MNTKLYVLCRFNYNKKKKKEDDLEDGEFISTEKDVDKLIFIIESHTQKSTGEHNNTTNWSITDQLET